MKFFLALLFVLTYLVWADCLHVILNSYSDEVFTVGNKDANTDVARSNDEPIIRNPETFNYIIRKYKVYCGDHPSYKCYDIWEKDAPSEDYAEILTYHTLCCERKEEEGKLKMTGVNRCCMPHISDETFDLFNEKCCSVKCSEMQCSAAKCCSKQGIFGKDLLEFNATSSTNATIQKGLLDGAVDYGIYCCRNGINMCCDVEKALHTHHQTGWPI